MRYVKPIRIAALLLTTALLPGCSNKPEADSREVEAIIDRYLVNHPERLQVALDNLLRFQESNVAAASSKVINGSYDKISSYKLNNLIGSAEAKRSIIMFSDHNCGYCAAAITKLVNNETFKNGNYNIIIRELPLLSDNSRSLSEISLSSNSTDSYNDIFMKIHGMTREEKSKFVKSKVEIETKASDIIDLEIKQNMSLAKDLGITGTPAFIVGKRLIKGWNEAAVMGAFNG